MRRKDATDQRGLSVAIRRILENPRFLKNSDFRSRVTNLGEAKR